jgi:phosphoglycerate dehydrogenase-like enzyme
MCLPNPYVSAEKAQSAGVTLHSIEEVPQRADLVTLHVSSLLKKPSMVEPS